MLNRLFIVIGILAILALAGAFIVPRFIQWGDYRDRLEAVASEALGTHVEIVGDIEFNLLPQPQLKFSQVVVGQLEEPVLAIANVEAEFSLLDFLRDQYRITKLVLDRPDFRFGIDANGAIETGVTLAEQVSNSNIAIENATIAGGTLVIADARSGGSVTTTDIAGELKLSALRGPFAFQGSGTLNGAAYDFRFSTSVLDADGQTKLSVFARPLDDGYSLTAEGTLVTGASPKFSGDLTIRQKPPAGTAADARGDLLLTSPIEAGADRILLSSYTLVPDENRAGTRLTGAASLQLGADPKFDAVVSGGVMALPPRDATVEPAVAPYELVRLLGELPAPPALGVPGTIGVDIAEFNIRAVALRNVRFDAVNSADGWELRDFSADLPGNTALKLSGMLTTEAGRPRFEGVVAMATPRLDGLASLWRKPAEDNPLFNLPGSLSGNLSIAGQTLTLSAGTLMLGESSHEVAAAIGFGETRRVDVSADFSDLSPELSAAVGALLPDAGAGGSFGVTFPRGSVALTAKSATVLGLGGQGLVASGSWEGGILELKKLSARDLGGAEFALALTAFGTLQHPEMSGDGTLKVGSADAPALERLFEATDTPPMLRDFLKLSLPVDLALRLDAPSGDGGQVLTVAGHAGVGELNAEAKLGAGLLRAVGAPIGLTLELVSADVPGLTAQLGLGGVDLLPPEGPMHVALALEGTPNDDLKTNVTVEAGGDSLSFVGDVFPRDPSRWTGGGVINAKLSEPSAVAELLGVGGLHVPALAGSAQITFGGLDRLKITDIAATANGQQFTGELALLRQGQTRTVSGKLALGTVSVDGLAAVLVGPAGLIKGGDSLWPDGPLAVAEAPRTTTGRVTIESPVIVSGTAPVLTDLTLAIDWDANNLRLRQLTGDIGGGTLVLDAGVCCAGTTADKTLSGRVSVDHVELGALLPEGFSTGLSAILDGSARFEGTGSSLLGAISTLAGEGNFVATDVRAEGFAPEAFASIAGLENILDMEPDALAVLISQALEKGPYTAPEIAGSFTIAGGTLRSPNLAVDSKDVRLFGGGSLNLADLSLDGAYTLTPVGSLGTGGLINEATSQVTARISGTLLQPERTFDVASMVDAIKVKAYEIELAQLEKLQAEDEERQRVAAEERARVLAEEKAAREAADKVSSVTAALDAVLAGEKMTLKAGEAVVAMARQAAELTLADNAVLAGNLDGPAATVPPGTDVPGAEVPLTTTVPPLELAPAEPATQF